MEGGIHLELFGIDPLDFFFEVFTLGSGLYCGVGIMLVRVVKFPQGVDA